MDLTNTWSLSGAERTGFTFYYLWIVKACPGICYQECLTCICHIIGSQYKLYFVGLARHFSMQTNGCQYNTPQENICCIRCFVAFTYLLKHNIDKSLISPLILFYIFCQINALNSLNFCAKIFLLRCCKVYYAVSNTNFTSTFTVQYITLTLPVHSLYNV